VGLFSTHAGTDVASLLRAIGADGRVYVINHSRLARHLAQAGFDVAERRQAAAVDEDDVAAVVLIDVARAADWAEQLGDARRRLGPDGMVVLVDRGHRLEATRRAVCGGLSEVGQRPAGRWMLTYGCSRALGADAGGAEGSGPSPAPSSVPSSG